MKELTILTISDGDQSIIQIKLNANRRVSLVTHRCEHIPAEEMEKQITQAMVALHMLGEDIAKENGRDKAHHESVFNWIAYKAGDTVNNMPSAARP